MQPYSTSASIYDAIYGGRNYAEQVSFLRFVLKLSADLGRPQSQTLLDVACGTGLHLEHLLKWLHCEGLDLSEGQLAVARQKFPKVPLHHGDMKSFDLDDKKFDVITCMFGSIAYAETLEGITQVLSRRRSPVSRGLMPFNM